MTKCSRKNRGTRVTSLFDWIAAFFSFSKKIMLQRLLCRSMSGTIAAANNSSYTARMAAATSNRDYAGLVESYARARQEGEQIDSSSVRNAFRALHRAAVLNDGAYVPDLKIILDMLSDLTASDVDSFSTRDFNHFIDFLALYRRPAVEYFNVLKLMRQLPSAQLDKSSIFGLVRGLTSVDEVEQAEDVLAVARQNQIPVDLAPYDLLVKGYLRRTMAQSSAIAGKEDLIRADSNVKRATEITLKLANEGQLRLDTRFLANFAVAHSRLENPRGCQFWVDLGHKLRVKPLTPLYNSLLEAYCRVGDRHAAFACYNHMVASSDRSLLWPNSYTFSSMIRLLASRNRRFDSSKIFDLMRSLKAESDTNTYNVILWHFAKSGNVRKVEECYKRMMKEGVQPSILTFNSRIVARATQANIHPRNSDMLKLLERSEAFSAKSAFEPVYDEILAIFDDLKASSIAPNSKTINTIAACAWLIGDRSRAFQVLEEGERTILTQASSQVRQTGIEQELLTAPDPMAVGEHFDELANTRAVLDITSFNLLIMLHLSCKDFAGAFDVLTRRMPMSKVPPDEYTLYYMVKHAMSHQLIPELTHLVDYMRHRRRQLGGSGR